MTARGPGKKATTDLPAETATTPHRTVPEEEQELRQQIEQTRQDLGETMEQLVARTDMAARARANAAEATERMKGSMRRVRTRAAAQGQAAASQVAPVWDKAPEPLRRTVEKAASGANQRRAPLAAAAATLVAGYLAVRWWRKAVIG
jgi:ABC-type transporter Mla subunit MlaD